MWFNDDSVYFGLIFTEKVWMVYSSKIAFATFYLTRWTQTITTIL